MKTTDRNRTKKGQTLLEIIAVLVIIGAILAAVIPAVTTSTDNGRIQSALASIRAIQSAAVGFYNDNGGSYASITIGGLSPKYLPAGAASNPWSGSITVGPNGTTTNQYIITLSNVPSTANTPLTNALVNTSISTTYTAKTNSYAVTLS